MKPEQTDNQSPNPPLEPGQLPTTPAPGPGQPIWINDINSMPTPPTNDQPSAVIPPTLAETQMAGPMEPAKKKRWPKDGWRSIFSTLLLFLVAPVIALSIAAFALQSYQVDGQSMETTLQDRDRLIVDKISRTWSRLTGHVYVPHRGDIVIFNQAGLDPAGQNRQLIKRVIGLPGERVRVKDGKVTIYNSVHPDGFNPDSSSGYQISALITPGNVDLTIPSGQIFVCGDNRTNSEDSRYFGPVNVGNIVGKLVLRLFPLDKAERF